MLSESKCWVSFFTFPSSQVSKAQASFTLPLSWSLRWLPVDGSMSTWTPPRGYVELTPMGVQHLRCHKLALFERRPHRVYVRPHCVHAAPLRCPWMKHEYMNAPERKCGAHTDVREFQVGKLSSRCSVALRWANAPNGSVDGSTSTWTPPRGYVEHTRAHTSEATSSAKNSQPCFHFLIASHCVSNHIIYKYST